MPPALPHGAVGPAPGIGSAELLDPALVFALAAAPVLLGAALAWAPRADRRLLGPAWTFAFASALVVSLGELVPEAAAELGAGALLLFGLGLVLPGALEALARRAGAGRGLGSAAVFGGLLAHQAAEGALLGAGWSTGDGPRLAVAIAAHTGPLIAVWMLDQDPARPGARGRAAAALALVTGLSAALARWAPGAVQAHSYDPYLQALLGGLVLHVLAHGTEVEGPRGRAGRAVDLAAAAAGAALPLALAGHGHAHAAGGFAAHLWDLAMDTAPPLFAGLLLAVLVGAAPRRRAPPPELPPARAAAEGLLAAATSSACGCGTPAAARELDRLGGPAAFGGAFLLGAPALGIDTLALSTGLMGPAFAGLRLFGAAAVSVAAGLALRGGAPTVPPAGAADAPPPALGAAPAMARIDQLAQEVAPWVAGGLVGAAWIQAHVQPEDLRPLVEARLDLPLFALLAAPAWVCASALTPIAAVLWAKGASPGALLAALLIGPALHLPAHAALAARWGPRAARRALLAGLATALAVAWAAQAVPLPAPPLPAEHHHGPAAQLAAALLGALGLRALWRSGLRGWTRALVQGAHAPHPHR